MKPYSYQNSFFFATLLCLAVLTGCMSTPVLQPAATTTKQQPQAKTLAEIQLEQIIVKQQKLFADLNASLATAAPAVQQQKVNAVDAAYRSFISDNPNYIFGYMLYGKFLRAVGDFATANVIFVKANELEGDYAVIKQQIGNYLAEEGEYGLALAYLASAIELEPYTALYHFQVGELLYTYRDAFIDSEILTSAALARQQFTAFAHAARLAPNNRTFQLRYAEAFFDADAPDWATALRVWQGLAASATDPIERDIIYLQQARVWIELNAYEQARTALAHVTRTALQEAKEELLAKME